MCITLLQCFEYLQVSVSVVVVLLLNVNNISLLNLVEAHCYGIERTGGIIEQHVAEKINRRKSM